MATLSPQEILRRLDSDELALLAGQVESFQQTQAFRFLNGFWDSERRRSHEQIESGALRGEAAYALAAGYARGLAAGAKVFEQIVSEARRAEEHAKAAERGTGE